jgi:hypothetical protein
MRSPVEAGHVRPLLGLFVLGGATPEERRLVISHLAECESCQAAHEEIKDLPSALAMMTTDDLALLNRKPPARRLLWSRLWSRLRRRDRGAE